MYVIDCLVKYFYKYEAAGWLNTKNLLIPGRDIFKNCHKILRKYKHQGKLIDIQYVKGHSGILGNVQADRLAGLIAGKPPLPDYIDESTICNDVAINTVETCLSASTTNESIVEKNMTSRLPQCLEDIIPHINTESQEIDYIDEWEVKKPKSKSKIGNTSKSQIKSIDYSNSDIYWIKPAIVKMDIENANNVEHALSESDNEHIEILNSAEKEEVKERLLFLTCMECANTVLVKYPSNHVLAGEAGINFNSSHVLAITKCRECITENLKDDEYINISVEMEKHDKSLSSLRISDKIIMDSPCHHTANEIAGKGVPILTESRYIKYVPINIISKLCGKDTKSISIDTTKCIELPYLNNGFL